MDNTTQTLEDFLDGVYIIFLSAVKKEFYESVFKSAHSFSGSVIYTHDLASDALRERFFALVDAFVLLHSGIAQTSSNTELATLTKNKIDFVLKETKELVRIFVVRSRSQFLGSKMSIHDRMKSEMFSLISGKSRFWDKQTKAVFQS